MSKKFSVGQILSAVSGRFLTDDFGEVYDILNYVTQDDLFTHQLIRAQKESAIYIKNQHAWIGEVMRRSEWENPTEWWNENWKKFVEEIEDRYGKLHSLKHMPLEDHEIIDPIEEFQQMVDPNKIIIVTDEPDSPSDIGDISWKVDDEE